jgi:hypothetical protein
MGEGGRHVESFKRRSLLVSKGWVQAVLMIGLALFVLVVATARNHDPTEAALLAGVLIVCLLIGRGLLRDFRSHPAGFPNPAPSHGVRLARQSMDRASDRASG